MRTWKLTRGWRSWNSSNQGSNTWRPRSEGIDTDSVPEMSVLLRATAFLPASKADSAERACSR